MPLPAGLTTILVTDTYLDLSGKPLAGSITFTPTSQLSDSAGNVVFPLLPVTAAVSQATGTFSVRLPCTDNTALSPSGWAYLVEIGVPGVYAETFTALFPSTLGASVQLRTVAPIVPPGPPIATAVTSINGQSGAVELTASTVGADPAGAAAAETTRAEAAEALLVPLSDLPLTLLHGGTGQSSQATALTALAGTQSAGKYLRSDGTNTALANIAAGDLPAATTSTQGAVILDGTSTDVQAAGVQSAGGSVTTHAAYADHIHPGPAWIPSDSGLLAANFDPFMTAGAASPMSAGLIYFLQVQVRYSFTWTNVVVMVTSIGSGTSTGCFAGLYNSSGSRVAVSADCASFFTGTTVAQYIPMAAPYTTTAGTFLWVALLCNLGTTQVTLAKNSIGNQGNVGYPIASNPIYLRAAKYTTNSQTALPSSFTPSSALSSSGETAFWAGAS